MTFAALHGWFAQHLPLAALAVFLIALAESLAVVGLFVPGVAMMFAAGALVGSGALGFWPICAAAVIGAIAGDGFSYWLGWHYRGSVGRVWPFIRHPGLLNSGVAFFRRHGTWSVLLGRFVGPTRAVIPLAAGMLAMPPRLFLAMNVLSALLWGPVYLLPGMAFGASLELATRVAGRLVFLLALLGAILWLTVWLGRGLLVLGRRHGATALLALFYLFRQHPWLARRLEPWIGRGRPAVGPAVPALLILLLPAALLVSNFAPSAPTVTLTEREWLQDGWRLLPDKREAFFGQEELALTVQWAGSPGDIQSALSLVDWRRPRPLSFANLLFLLNPEAARVDLPVLPHVHRTGFDALRLIRPLPDGRCLIFRLWRTGDRLEPGGVPLWVGSVAFLEVGGSRFLRYADETGATEEASQRLAADLRPRVPIHTAVRDDGRSVLLIPHVTER